MGDPNLPHNHTIIVPAIAIAIAPINSEHSTPLIPLPVAKAVGKAVEPPPVAPPPGTADAVEVLTPPVSPARISLAVDLVGNVVDELKLSNFRLA